MNSEGQKKKQPKEEEKESLPDPRELKVKELTDSQEQRDSVRNKIRKFNSREQKEESSYESWRASRKEAGFRT